MATAQHRSSLRRIRADQIGDTPISLPPLPFAANALEPVISARTLKHHHGNHHASYVKKLEEAVAGTPLAGQTVEQIILATTGKPGQAAIFNSAAQLWNHNFYWQSLSPAATGPSAELLAALDRDFGGLRKATDAMVETATAHFGSGWGWLACTNDGALDVLATADAEVPFTDGLFPLLTLDVWEHAYYLDWQHRREDHLAAVAAKHLNWAFASANFARACE
jgi:superoxide dismutase, Fe-Mn family